MPLIEYTLLLIIYTIDWFSGQHSNMKEEVIPGELQSLLMYVN